jgi:hypothetical protein
MLRSVLAAPIRVTPFANARGRGLRFDRFTRGNLPSMKSRADGHVPQHPRQGFERFRVASRLRVAQPK